MDRWEKYPGEKVEVPLRVLEAWLHHFEHPELFSQNQYRENARRLREELDRVAVNRSRVG